MQSMTKKSSLTEIIKNRRTIRTFLDTPMDREIILGLLDIAVWAPTHKKRQPWRFLLIEGDGRKKLADVIINEAFSEEERHQKAAKMREQLEQIPLHLIVVMKAEEKRKQWHEDFAATSAIIQNFQLLCWEEGIGVVWKTNPYIWKDGFRTGMEIEDDEYVVGVLHLGYFDQIPEPYPRISARNKTTIISK